MPVPSTTTSYVLATPFSPSTMETLRPATTVTDSLAKSRTTVLPASVRLSKEVLALPAKPSFKRLPKLVIPSVLDLTCVSNAVKFWAVV